MRHYALAATALVALLLSLSACRPPAPAEAVDEGSTAAAHAERVVSLVPNVTELIFAVGAGDLMVARSQHCNHPDAATALPSIGSGFTPDVERILALEPTLVVASELQTDLPALQVLRDADVEVMVLPDATLDDVPTSLRTLGERLGHKERAESLAQAFVAEFDALRAATADVDTVRAAIIVARDPIYAAGPESRLDAILAAAGGSNVLADGDWVQLDPEALIALAPSVIIEPDSAGVAAWWQRWNTIPAVADGRLCTVDDDELSRSGPRLTSAARDIARCLHPALVLDDPASAQ